MLKRQENAMAVIARQANREILRSVYHKNGYAYVTNSYQAYRIPSGQKDNMPDSYPYKDLDRLMKRTADKSYIEYPINTEKVNYDCLTKIGENYYQIKFVKQAIRILGKNITCYQDIRKQFSPLILESNEGVGVILPVMVCNA